MEVMRICLFHPFSSFFLMFLPYFAGSYCSLFATVDFSITSLVPPEGQRQRERRFLLHRLRINFLLFGGEVGDLWRPWSLKDFLGLEKIICFERCQDAIIQLAKKKANLEAFLF